MKKKEKKKTKSGGKTSRTNKRPQTRKKRPEFERRDVEAREGEFYTPELLAPAGGPVTWAAALEAGADAVYLGLKDFSARAFASNFSMAELKKVVEITHEKNARIYIALNTMLKEAELPQVARKLDLLSKIGPDALIIQDIGLFRLIKKHFPQFEVHASTLMATHNLPGLQVLAGMGYDRAVLARELTLKEISYLARSSPIPVEIFIHGALCFGFSGQCLMSSFLGGKGSLRGACTQPCRRVYTSGRKRGYFFSPTDLDASSVMQWIRRTPVSTLKIEGRMKGAEYVARVVKGYRMLLDSHPDDLDYVMGDVLELLDGAPGRKRTSGFFTSRYPAGVMASGMTATSGIFLGRITDAVSGGGLLTIQNRVEIGDRLRVQFKKDDERQAFTLKRMTAGDKDLQLADNEDEVIIAAPFSLNPGDLVFRVDSGRIEKDASSSALVRAVVSEKSSRAREADASPALKRALKTLVQTDVKAAAPGAGRQDKKTELWYRIARAEDVSGIADVKPDRVVLPLTTANVRRMVSIRKRIGYMFNKVIWSLPPLVFDTELTGLRKDLAQLARLGCREFMISNLGQIPLVEGYVQGRRGAAVVYADHRLNCLNTQTEAMLSELGVSGVTLSIESDEENLKNVLAKPSPISRLFYIFGRPPLFTSRFRPENLKDNLPVLSPKKERFRIKQEQEYFTMFSEKPVFFSPVLKYRSLPGVASFIIDLEFDPRPLASARDAAEAIIRKKPMGNTSRFNFTRGLY